MNETIVLGTVFTLMMILIIGLVWEPLTDNDLPQKQS